MRYRDHMHLLLLYIFQRINLLRYQNFLYGQLSLANKHGTLNKLLKFIIEISILISRFVKRFVRSEHRRNLFIELSIIGWKRIQKHGFCCIFLPSAPKADKKTFRALIVYG